LTRHGARLVVETDRAAVSAMLARAFFEDPVMVFMFPDPEARRRKLPRLFDLLVAANLPLDGCDVTAGGETATLWRPPGKADIPVWEILLHLPEFLGIYGLAGARRALRLLGAMERHHPKEPHWYLMVIGTDPPKQGQGFGGAALRHRLTQIDAAHLPAYLEASKIENVPIYSVFGFEQRDPLQIPGGPLIYPMWRPAR
jgi:GNAT superfamily N-acetyltransferase